jgi:hypothetical protein
MPYMPGLPSLSPAKDANIQRASSIPEPPAFNVAG